METYHGHVKTQLDAILLFEACRLGMLPRVQRRLSERERLQIKSGSVYVWNEKETGMKRWTDGKPWSASRVSGSFLTYREMESGTGAGASSANSRPPSPPNSKSSTGTSTPKKGSDGLQYKKNGLYKQSFSLTTKGGMKFHLISYYKREDVHNKMLVQPSQDPGIKEIQIPGDFYPDNTASGSLGPAVIQAPMNGHMSTTTTHRPGQVPPPPPPPPQASSQTTAGIAPPPPPPPPSHAYHPIPPMGYYYQYNDPPRVVGGELSRLMRHPHRDMASSPAAAAAAPHSHSSSPTSLSATTTTAPPTGGMAKPHLLVSPSTANSTPYSPDLKSSYQLNNIHNGTTSNERLPLPAMALPSPPPSENSPPHSIDSSSLPNGDYAGHNSLSSSSFPRMDMAATREYITSEDQRAIQRLNRGFIL